MLRETEKGLIVFLEMVLDNPSINMLLSDEIFEKGMTALEELKDEEERRQIRDSLS